MVRAWNVDHFSTQEETQFHHGQDAMLLSPIRFQHPTVTLASSGRGRESQIGLMAPGISRSLAESGRMIDEHEDEERRRRVDSYRIP